VFRGGPIPIRDLAQQVGLPIPVIAAIRGELEKRGMLERRGGVALSAKGDRVVREALGFSCRRQFGRAAFPPFPAEAQGALDRLSTICDGRPDVDVTLDQSHATPETVLERALYVYEHDGLEARDILVLGDDDLTSVGLGILSQWLETQPACIRVLDCDPRLVAYIEEVAAAEDLPIEAVRCDFRDGLPADEAGRYEVFFTDPPYTLEGLNLFVSRGVEALRPQVGKQGYICFGQRAPDETAEVIRGLVDMGLSPVEILPGFNRYVGAQVLAGVSQMIRTISTSHLRPTVRGEYAGPLYTAELKRSRQTDGR
jgi:predicted methyltransferase